MSFCPIPGAPRMSTPPAPDESRAMLANRPASAANVEAASPDASTITRVAVGVDDFPEGRDAAALGAALARVMGAELMLATVHSPPLVPLPPDMGWRSVREGSQVRLRAVRRLFAPDARTVTETDYSVARGLHRVVRQHHSELLVVGSSRHGPEGRVRIGKRTRQLLCHFECALAVAPRGNHSRPTVTLREIAVGYDGSPESASALAIAGTIASAAGAELHVCAVVDDRHPRIALQAKATLGNGTKSSARRSTALVAGRAPLRGRRERTRTPVSCAAGRRTRCCRCQSVSICS